MGQESGVLPPRDDTTELDLGKGGCQQVALTPTHIIPYQSLFLCIHPWPYHGHPSLLAHDPLRTAATCRRFLPTDVAGQQIGRWPLQPHQPWLRFAD